jgi:hypothetical protein
MALRVRTHVRTGQAAAAQGGGGGGTLILDTLGVTAKLALSTRKLRTAYAGSALQVRRSSDNTTQDIGFDGSGNLDTAALATFVGANSAFVSKWYDQSGAGADAVQATNANQPRIRNAGTNDLISTQPALNFTSVTHQLISPASSGLTNTENISVVAQISSNAGIQALLGSGAAAGSGLEFRIETNTSMVLNAQSAALLGTSTGAAITNATPHVLEASYIQTGAWAFWADGTAKGSGSTAQSVTAGSIYLGVNAAGDVYTGTMGEVLVFDLSGGLTNRSTLQTDQKAYWGTP